MKKRYLFIIIIVILGVILHFLSVSITPMLKKIATKEIDRFCQMVINNTPFPVELDHQELIKVNRSGNEISTINFDTNYASSIGAKIVNNLDELFVSLEEGAYKKTDDTFYQRKLEEISNNGGVIASVPLGMMTDNPFLAEVGPKIKIRYKTISAITCTVNKEIKSYGVNHVMVSLSLTIKIKMMVLLPFYNEEFNKAYDYPLVIEIIEGEVPNWYQN
ncbi:sporulation protein YunB [Thomasclavelia saccharogumia]|uniref:sporulation protein YunB n=1 Tax=Thomasclavelia saccharogumia TaxID=341225 RepID=UPI00047AECDF|nr:sporulation protein YunB [Thomasclavelia saccharogumia]